MSDTVPSRANSPRPLACVTCRIRKVKCDKKIPCSNCVKANVKCASNTPKQRKGIRHHEDLRQRLARCEDALTKISAQTLLPTEKPNAPEAGTTRTKHYGQLVDSSGSPHLVENELWATVHNELHAIHGILDNAELVDDSSRESSSTTSSLETGIVFQQAAPGDLIGCYPQSVHIFYLWQVFLDRIHPLTRILHSPTMQPIMMKASAGVKQISASHVSLLFAICLTATVALKDAECTCFLGVTKQEAIHQYTKGLRAAFNQIDLSSNHDLVVLQALVLYMIAITGRFDSHGAWIVFGFVIRIAQKMGLHRDGDHLDLPPFEAEMRRRIWWQIVLLDTVSALSSGMSSSLLLREWDTKKPSNISDSELVPSMKELRPENGPTDMIFLLMYYEIGKTLIEQPTLQSPLNWMKNDTLSSSIQDNTQKPQSTVTQLDAKLQDIFNQYGNPAMGAVHELASEMRHTLWSRVQELTQLANGSTDKASTKHSSPMDIIFNIAIVMGEHDIRLYQATEKSGCFSWFALSRFQSGMFSFMVGQLATHKPDESTKRAWEVVNFTYTHHTELFEPAVKLHLGLAAQVLKAWDAHGNSVQNAPASLFDEPDYIVRLREMLEPRAPTWNTTVDDSLDQINIEADSSGGGAFMNQGLDPFASWPGNAQMWQMPMQNPQPGEDFNFDPSFVLRSS
ncbi:hypothetical protein PFICI_06916 [Pestalotiopsis fici W106-1]|uniref:Zn(2)-C6 fungal-type domain-containing protein n=1 Tax=Pestalotiopsis fici (strain W106-1 / CGMCC3.15140) TaxID=1229662 RepID=W3X7A6_PESFW|nr:uncharacterized protein PFICI_06916 [Pestalotiopsis fici W106-1]ETS81914.1 hypothetical protein PFICI_06916 [Pestalotiopsis fici W106-1]